MQVQSYLIFEGRCEEAIAFYRKAVGAEVVMLMRFKENPDPPPPGVVPHGSEDKVMHAELRIGDTVLMLSDGMCAGATKFGGFMLSLSVADEAEADRKFAALGDGGRVEMALGKTFFSPRFGMVTDRFGVTWAVIAQPEAGR